ncbi:MAG: beta-CASP ribonuclease aCPSF1 [Thermoplasmatales archaeon]|nr:beta-CASP ribonuclease aCPSF1 [Thermoplasmatales archaeon]
MKYEEIIANAKENLETIFPGLGYTSLDMEGANVVLYSKESYKFLEDPEKIKKLAQSIRKRIIIRPDSSSLVDEKEAEEMIRKILPEDVSISDIFFEHDSGEVIIEVDDPERIQLYNSQIIATIRKDVKWAPRIMRTPPIKSATIKMVREFLKAESDERRKFLKNLAKRISRDPLPGENFARLTCLGAWREVGRASSLLMTKNSKIMIDCGLDPGAVDSDDPASGAPYLGAPELWPLNSVDGVVLTHSHLDHSGFLPYLFNIGYDGPVYMTAPARDLLLLLLMDYVKLGMSENRKIPYKMEDVRNLIRHTVTLNYNETTDISPDIRVTLRNAGHILGSSVVHFHIGEGFHNLLMSGDIKYMNSWLFNAADSRLPRVETFVTESTYGGRNDFQPSRQEAGERLAQIIRLVTETKGKVLIPVFAVGRSQEVMLVIEEKYRLGEIPKVPVYLDGMIYEATSIHTAYPEFLNSNLRDLITRKKENPFLSDIFTRVDAPETRENIVSDVGPLVVLATSGMMNGGPVIEYFSNWADDERNFLLFVGYQAEGTLGRRILSGTKQLNVRRNNGVQEVKISMRVDTVDGFSGHSDRRQLMKYIEALEFKPKRILVNHGDASKATEFSRALSLKFGVESYAPYNLETVRLR